VTGPGRIDRIDRGARQASSATGAIGRGTTVRAADFGTGRRAVDSSVTRPWGGPAFRDRPRPRTRTVRRDRLPSSRETGVTAHGNRERVPDKNEPQRPPHRQEGRPHDSGKAPKRDRPRDGASFRDGRPREERPSRPPAFKPGDWRDRPRDRRPEGERGPDRPCAPARRPYIGRAEPATSRSIGLSSQPVRKPSSPVAKASW
jgi:hypothetical protein